MSLWGQPDTPTTEYFDSLGPDLKVREHTIRAQRSWQLETESDIEKDIKKSTDRTPTQTPENPQDQTTIATTTSALTIRALPLPHPPVCNLTNKSNTNSNTNTNTNTKGNMSSKDLDVEMAETKEQKRPKQKIRRSATTAAQESSKRDLREAYERRKALIPILCRWNNITFYLSMLGIIITLTEMELSRHLYNNDFTQSLIPLILKIVMTISTILCMASLVQYWTVKVNIFRAKELVHKTATVWNTHKFRNQLIMELFVISLHVPPYLDQVIGYIYGDLHFNVLGLFVFLRLYIIPRIMKQQFKTKFVSLTPGIVSMIVR